MKIFTVLLLLAIIVVTAVHSLKPGHHHKTTGAHHGKHHSTLSTELFPYDPVADPSAVIVSGKARFTVLTNHIIRMEYTNAANGMFEDRATMAFLNRKLAVPKFTSGTNGGVLTITTSALKLTYTVGQPFSPSSLSVSSNNASSVFKSWTYGEHDSGNLLGTIKSLDELDVISLNCTLNANITVHDESLHCEWGLISRNGWTVVDDTTNWGLTSQTANPPEWWDSMNTDALDLYFFGHGQDYYKALYEFTLLSGPISMVPRYASGIWWSRWYNLDNKGVMEMVDNYESRDIPLDVFVLDMDWHTKQGWGGYSFDERLFPIPAATLLSYLRNEKGLHTSVNLHDDDGVKPNENEYAAFAKYMGISNGQTIPFSIVNATYMYGLEDIVLKAIEDEGVDLMWIDWQQGGTQGGAAGHKQNPTIWLNHMRSTDHVRRGENIRGTVLARWGGLGNHRYQVGFSGDVNNLSWADLAFQPYFSMTSSNVAYGFWSHDLVGPYNDHEMHTRWIQWGAYSGVFRTHDRGMASGGCANTDPYSCAIVEIWKAPDMYFVAMREAMLARERLIPLLYTSVRHAFDTGVSIIRPMYYAYPAENNAYMATPDGNSLSQYNFATENMIVSPITVPSNTTTFLTQKTVWIPSGTWYEATSGVLRTGGSSVLLTKQYELREVPIYVKAGSIIPEIDVGPGRTIARAMKQYDPLVFVVYPGGGNGGSSVSVYEDDGLTFDYISNKYIWTTASYTKTSNSLTMTISSTGNSYTGLPQNRALRIKILSALPASSITVNNQNIPYSRNGGAGSGTWKYEGTELALIIDTFPVATLGSPSVIKISYISNIDDAAMSGIKGIFVHAEWAKEALDETWATPGSGSVNGGNISICAATAKELNYLAGNDTNTFMQALSTVRQSFAYGTQEIIAIKPSSVKVDMSKMDHGVPKSNRGKLFTERQQGLVGMDAYQRWAYAVTLLANAQ